MRLQSPGIATHHVDEGAADLSTPAQRQDHDRGGSAIIHNGQDLFEGGGRCKSQAAIDHQSDRLV